MRHRTSNFVIPLVDSNFTMSSGYQNDVNNIEARYDRHILHSHEGTNPVGRSQRCDPLDDAQGDCYHLVYLPSPSGHL